ncbi:MAG: class II glutamine amidotransferase, partial [Gemmatimonadales bacterium]|nr:class II glutamine amidotransferase [Gemmatimonadales bacterium]
MCGIVGYVGPKQAVPLLMEGLRRLEYRGYDSAGVAVVADGRLTVLKAAGKIAMLEAQIGRMPVKGTTGIAHTRWATHGAPTTKNAHPHTDCGDVIAVVHNGIIENSTALRTMLRERGHKFVSETDTEVIAHLIEQFYNGKLEDAVGAALRELEGAYGIAVVSAREPDTIVAARRGSPLLVGVGDGENFVAS